LVNFFCYSASRVIKIKKPDNDPNEQIRYCGWAKKKNAIVSQLV